MLHNARSSRGRRGERGMTLAIVSIGIVSVILAGGMCVDFSRLYMAQIELQDAADAAAIAAASQLNSTSGGVKSAVREATKQLNKYDINSNVTIPASAVTFATNLNGTYVSQASAESTAANIRFVAVNIPAHPVPVSFLSSVIGVSRNLTAKAVAGQSVSLTMNKFYSAFIFIEPNSTPLVPGQTYTLTPKIWSSNAATSYRILAGVGGDLITSGTIHAYGFPTGNYVVQKLSQTDDCRLARIGVNTRFADYSIHPSANSIDHPPDTIISGGISYATYTTNQGNNVIERADGVFNRRIITVPIAKSNAYNTTTANVTANRLGAFFIKSKINADCNLSVEYIAGHLVVPIGEFRTGSIQLNELSVAVLYR